MASLLTLALFIVPILSTIRNPVSFLSIPNYCNLTCRTGNEIYPSKDVLMDVNEVCQFKIKNHQIQYVLENQPDICTKEVNFYVPFIVNI